MPRKNRTKSRTGIYHIVQRGINRQTIFCDREDHTKYLQTLEECKKISGFCLYGYCLMGNHIHLLIKVGEEELQQIFKRIGVRYVIWYNQKYDRSGHLFQDRFHSQNVEDERYFIAVLNYIHQNPKKAGMVDNLASYQWSSYNDYIDKQGITDTDFLQGLIGKSNAAALFKPKEDYKFLDVPEPKRKLTDDEIIAIIHQRYQMDPVEIQNHPKEIRDNLLRKLLTIRGITSRNLSRVTGISTNIIWKL